MKNIYKILFLSIFVFAIGCENETDPRFQDLPETGWIQFGTASTTVAVTDRTTTIRIPVQFTAPINLSNVNVTYSVSIVSGGAPSTVVTGLGSSLTIAGNTNLAFIELDPVSDAVQQLIDNGDSVFDITLTGADRGLSVGLADGSARVTHTVNLLCGGEPLPGGYVVDMQDSWGDGWQTTTNGGGDGMTVTLIDVAGDETIIEFGMCSLYSPADGFLSSADCTPTANGYDASTVITIPPGTVDAIWSFPGDRWGEIEFQIYNPSGVQLYSSPGGPGGQSEGDITSISYCI